MDDLSLHLTVLFMIPKSFTALKEIFAVDQITVLSQNIFVLAFTCSAKYQIEKPQKSIHSGANLEPGSHYEKKNVYQMLGPD